MTSKLVVNNIESDVGVSTVTFSGDVEAVNFIGNVGAQATLSTPKPADASSITFTDVPVWAKKITVMFQGVSMSFTTRDILIRLGTSGGVINLGYVSSSSNQSGTTSSETTAFHIDNLGTTQTCSGHYTITKFDSSTYIGSSVVKHDTTALRFSAGELTGVSGTIDRVEISALSVFDAGQINVLYEG